MKEPNINVLRKQFIEDTVKESKGRLKHVGIFPQAKIESIDPQTLAFYKSRVTGNELVVEYHEFLQGRVHLIIQWRLE